MHALSIHEIRDMFGAGPELSAQLRTIASDTFRVPSARGRSTGLLSKIGPLFKRGDDVVFPPEMPLPSDWEVLLRGSYVKPERVEQSWTVVDAWVEALDWGTYTGEFTTGQLDDLDFALTKAGLPSQYGLRKLMGQDAQLPLMAGPRMHFGYSKNEHVLATRDALAAVIDEVDEQNRAAARGILDFLDGFAGWTEQARQQDRSAPDLFAVWWELGRADVPTAPVGH